MVSFRRSSFLLLACAIAVPMAGCASNRGKGDTSYVARDVASLYGAAKRAMDIRDYEQAAKLFDEVERQHPYSVWARRAQLMSAFNYYLSHKYTEAVSSAQRFVTIHPGNVDAPYAQYLIAMSYYEQIEGVTRDQSTTQAASDAFGELIRRYPDTRYADDAREKLSQITDHLAGKEMEVGRFYQRSENWLASTYRFRTVVDKYRTTTHTAEALERLVESYTALGMPVEAQRAAAVLGANYADTYWYRQSLRVLLKHRAKMGVPNVAGATLPADGPVTVTQISEKQAKRAAKSAAKTAAAGEKVELAPAPASSDPTKFPKGTVPPPPSEPQ